MLELLIIHDARTAQISHFIWEWLALSGGFFCYKWLQHRRGQRQSVLSGTGFWVVAGCLLGAAIGNKLVSLAQFPALWPVLGQGSWQQFLWAAASGQSVVGGLLGGWLGVEAGKKIAGIHSRTGDDFVVPILLGLAIGRIGCFTAGLHDGTYGIHTAVPWAVDFGDGPRHPTQLYECLAAVLVLCTYPRWRRFFAHEAGLAFRVLMSGYLLWRLLIDGLKPVPPGWPYGLSGIQWICLLALLVIGLIYRRSQSVQAA